MPTDGVMDEADSQSNTINQFSDKGDAQILSRLERTLGLWVDYAGSGIEIPEGVYARVSETSKAVTFAGHFSRWATLAWLPIPDVFRDHRQLRIRIILDLSEGAVVVAISDGTRKQYLKQQKLEGYGLTILELEAECCHPPRWVALRYGSFDAGNCNFELHSLQFQLRPHDAPVKLKRPGVARLPDEAVAGFPRWSGMVEPGFIANWLGVLTRREFLSPVSGGAGNQADEFDRRRLTPALPIINEEALEWTSILDSVSAARGEFTMIELGAGYGRWLVCAYGALRAARSELKPFFVGVEAEPEHFSWMEQHFIDNGLDPSEHRLIEAAVAGSDGEVMFTVGHSREWYGQAIVKGDKVKLERYPEAEVRSVTALSLSSIFRHIPINISRIDLIDMDIQGAEGDVIGNAQELISNRVKRVHIGTHSHAVEQQLREVFRNLAWRCIEDHACFSTSVTRYGAINFNDGVQVWENPKFD